MKSIKTLSVALLSLTFSLIVVETTRADDQVETLKKMLNAQQQVIESIKSQLDKVVAEQAKTKAELARFQQTKAAAPTSQPSVSQDSVVSTIEAVDRAATNKFTMSGYAFGAFIDSQGEPSTFGGQFNPIFNYKINDDLQFNGEIEVQLKDDSSEFDLEFAQLDYFAADNVTLSIGKWLVPFNTFGTRNHPAWINKMPSFPVIYEDELGGGRPGVVGLMTDVGVMAHGGVEITKDASANYALYLSNGPRNSAAAGETPSMGFGDNLSDNNNGKSFGGRIGILPISDLEVGWSGVGGSYDESNNNFFMWGDDAVYRRLGLEVRGEFIRLREDLPEGSTLTHSGWYSQASFRPGSTTWTADWPQFFKNLEPVVRVGRAETNDGDYDQVAPGVVYWLAESVPLKFAYEFNNGSESLGNNRVLAQIAYGF